MITVIGNSIVNGFPHMRSQSFTGVLKEKYGYDTVNRGINGDTAEGVLGRFDRDVCSLHPDICMILTGTNDFINGGTCESVFGNVSRMIEKAEGIKVFLLTPLLTAPKLAAKRWVPADYEAVNRNIAGYRQFLLQQKEAEVLDTQKALADFAEGRDEEEIYVDGIHPTEEAQSFLASFLDEELRKRGIR